MPARRTLTLLLAALLAGCSHGRRPIDGEKLEFHLNPSFLESTEISLTRGADRTIRGIVLRHPAFREPGQHSTIAKRFAIAAPEFDALAAALEDPKFQRLVEHAPIPGNDGTSYIFRHQRGSVTVELYFWQPMTVADERSRQAMALARRFAALAGMPELIATTAQ